MEEKEQQQNIDNEKMSTLFQMVQAYKQMLVQEKIQAVKRQEIFVLIIYLCSQLILWLSISADIVGLVITITLLHFALAICNILGSYLIATKMNQDQLEYVKACHEQCFLKYTKVVLFALYASTIGTVILLPFSKNLAMIYCGVMSVNILASLIASEKLKHVEFTLSEDFDNERE